MIFLLFFLCICACTATAQPFSVNVETSSPSKDRMVLLVYDQDSLPRSIKASRKDEHYCFSGSVNGPTYAELLLYKRKNTANPQTLPLFIEGSSISVSFNKDNPQASRVNGSRSNSIVRYQLELCSETNSTDRLFNYAAENHASPLTPYIIERTISHDADHETLSALFTLLDSNATRTYHYRLLARRLKQIEQLEAGLPLPSFTFIDQNNRPSLSDSLLTDSCRHAIVVGASWCSQCEYVMKTLADNHKDIKTIAIDIDRQPQGWDSPVAQKLAVYHIPYIILLDRQGRIAERDIRVWQIPK